MSLLNKNNYFINEPNLDIQEYDLLLEIKKIHFFLRKNNFFMDIEKKFVFHNYDFENENCFKQKKINQKLMTIINELNIKKNNNMFDIINKQKDDKNINKADPEDYIFLITNIKKKIKKKDLENKKIYREFQIKIKNINRDTKIKLNNILNIEKENFLKKENLQKNLLIDNKNLFQKKYDIILDVIKKFEENNISSNQRMNQIKKKQKIGILIIQQKYKSNSEQIEKQQNKIKNIFLKQIQKNEFFFRTELNNHNKILNQIQNEFFQKEKKLQKNQLQLFEQKKLKMFFFFEYTNYFQYKKFYSFIKENKQNQIKYLNDLYLWHNKYICLKFLHHKKINIINIQKKNEDNKNNFKIKENIILEKKEKEIINNQFFKEINSLEKDFRIVEIRKKYKIINIETEEEKKRNILKYSFLINKNKINIFLNNLDYQKKKILLKSTQAKKKYLLENQLQTKLIKLDHEYLKNTIQNFHKIKELNTKLTNLINIQCKQKKLQEMHFEQQKQYFLKKTEITIFKIENDIKKYLLNQEQNFNFIISFLNNMNQKNQEQNNLFQNIYTKVNKYKENLNNQKKIFRIEDFATINNLCQLFLKNIQNKQLDYYCILKNKINDLEQLNFQKNIDWTESILKYSEKNIFYIRTSVHKYKLKKQKGYKYIENQIKNYEHIYLSFKKRNFWLKQKQNKQQLKKQIIIQKLKKNQNKKLQKQNYLQKKISFYLEKEFYKINNKSFWGKILFWFYKKKNIFYWKRFWKNLDSLQNILNKEYIFLFQKINSLNKNIYKNKKEFLLKNQKKIKLLSNSFLNIIEEINLLNVKKLKGIQFQEINKINNQILFHKKNFEIQLQKRTKEHYLIRENLREALFEIDKYFEKKLNQIKIEMLNKENDLNQELNNQKNIFVKQNIITKEKKYLINKVQKKEEEKILFEYRKINKKYVRDYNILLKQESKIIKKNKHKLFLFFLQKKIALWKEKIIFWYKKIKNKFELKQNNYQKKKKINKKLKIQLFLYNKFNLFL